MYLPQYSRRELWTTWLWLDHYGKTRYISVAIPPGMIKLVIYAIPFYAILKGLPKSMQLYSDLQSWNRESVPLFSLVENDFLNFIQITAFICFIKLGKVNLLHYYLIDHASFYFWTCEIEYKKWLFSVIRTGWCWNV